MCHKIDPTKPKDIIRDLHEYYKAEVNIFSKKHHNQLLDFANSISDCHKKHTLFKNIEKPNAKMSSAWGYTYLTFDYLYMSMKLLMINYFAASGNMFRQSLESACMSILLSSNTLLQRKEYDKCKNIHVTKDYYFFTDYENNLKHTYPHKSIDVLLANYEKLNVNKEAIIIANDTKSFLNKFSHPSKIVMPMRMLGKDGRWTVNGNINKETISLKEHIESRINFSKIIPDIIENVMMMIEIK